MVISARCRPFLAVVLSTAILSLGTTIAGCNQGPGDYRQKPMQICLANAKTKSEKNDCYFANAEAHGN